MRSGEQILHEPCFAETSAGPVEVPIRYSDVSAVVALFTVERSIATELVAPFGLAPVRFGRPAVATLNVYDYRSTSIGPYREAALTVWARPAGQRRPAALDLLLPTRRRTAGFVVLDMPVTSERADAAGRELWGYPKYVGELSLALDPHHLEAAVRDPHGELVCTLRGALGRSIPFPTPDLVTYTSLHGRRWRTELTTGGGQRAVVRPPVHVVLGGSAHPMRTHLERLGLAGARPFAVLVSTDFRTLLHAGAGSAEVEQLVAATG